jgi:hypothetical protein
MDTGKGKFEMFQSAEELEQLNKRYPNHGAIFREGEIVELKGSRFRVSKIIRNGLKLALLPKENI